VWNFEILSSRRLIEIPVKSADQSTWAIITTTEHIQECGVNVSKAPSLEEIALDIVKLLHSYFR
jgi:hypothetical protein